MKCPIGWLKSYVPFDDTPEGLAHRLTFAGIEVEGMQRIGGDYEGMVAGEVREVRPHPGADRLQLCAVYDGESVKPVVCGAPLIEPGHCYAFAPPGSRLPGGAAVRGVRLRGETSQGMLCAPDELALSADHSGLLELPGSPAPGTPLAELLGPPDTVLELEITPNRPDCLSMLGIAREIAAQYGLRVQYPDADAPEYAPEIESLAQVSLQAPELCGRYVARLLAAIKIGPAPLWMQLRLLAAGVRPINNVVDITNYVMLESGQPLHAFDHRRLAGGRITVRTARAGEILRTLDGAEHSLQPEMLVIADDRRPVALAGIMGGADSEITATTDTLLLESAHFAAAPVRRQARALGVSSESAYRFAHGVNIADCEWAARRAAALLAKLAGGRLCRGTIDIYPRPPAKRRVTCRASRAAALTGLEADVETLKADFQALELPVVAVDGESVTVEVPSFREDLRREVDLVEEFSRIRGLDRIPAPAPRAIVIPDADDSRSLAVSLAGERLTALGLQEVMNYSLLAPELLDRLAADDPRRRVVLPRPISSEESVLRTSLLPQMVRTLGFNSSRQTPEAALFEIGTVFLLRRDGTVEESRRAALGCYGPAGRLPLDKQRPPEPGEMFRWLKGILEQWLRSLKAPACKPCPADLRPFADGTGATLQLGRRKIGCIGLLQREAAGEWRLPDPVALAEVELDPLLKNVFDVPPAERPPAYPPVTRDLALVADIKIRHEQIDDVIRRAAPAELEQVNLFDIYRGSKLPPGKQSLAYSLVFRSSERTLTDGEVNAYHNTVAQALKSELDIELREN